MPARWIVFNETIGIVTRCRQNQRRRSIMKKLFVAAALVLGTTSVSLAQGVYAAPGYGYGAGYYNYSPGYGYYNGGQGSYGYRNDYNYGPARNDSERGGPGPRVGAGSGMGIGSQR
jgi:hypothetical protein